MENTHHSGFLLFYAEIQNRLFLFSVKNHDLPDMTGFFLDKVLLFSYNITHNLSRKGDISCPATFQGSKNYVASEELIRSVNIAMALQKPLLIKGEPGTGKTVLAEAISEALGKKLVIWNIKSTTKAQDGLYVYDVVQRLYDSQFGNEGVDDIAKYVKMGKLGEAFSTDQQVILLIDEIDKADLEFPNDLLWELDKMELYIPETKETVKAKQRPIVIITSNAEKELPDAFLRRSSSTTSNSQMRNRWKKSSKYTLTKWKNICWNRYWKHSTGLPWSVPIQKKPSTSEVIDWIRALQLGGVDVDRIRQEVPFAGVLLKKNEDIDVLNRYFDEAG